MSEGNDMSLHTMSDYVADLRKAIIASNFLLSLIILWLLFDG